MTNDGDFDFVVDDCRSSLNSIVNTVLQELVMIIGEHFKAKPAR